MFPRGSKFGGFIQLDGIKWEKGGVTFVGAGSHQPK
jgi:hypothetical protein